MDRALWLRDGINRFPQSGPPPSVWVWGAAHDGSRAAGAKGAATEETRKGLRLRILRRNGLPPSRPPAQERGPRRRRSTR